MIVTRHSFPGRLRQSPHWLWSGARKTPSTAGDVTLASSPGATTSTTAGGPPVRLQSVRGATNQSESLGNAATTASGATTNIVFGSASGSNDVPMGGDVAKADALDQRRRACVGEFRLFIVAVVFQNQ